MAADGSVVLDVNMNIDQANKRLAKLKSSIEKTESEIDKATKARDEAKQKSLFDMEVLDAEKAKLQEIRDRLAEIRAKAKDKSIDLGTRDSLKAQIPSIQQEYQDQNTRVNMLQTEWNKLENSVSRYEQKIADSAAKLDQMKDEAGGLVEQINAAEKAQSGMSGAVNTASEYMERFANRIQKLASRVFVFTMITSALRAMRTWLGNTVKANDKAAAAIGRLKGALLTLAQPIVNVIIPAFITLVNIVTKVVSAIASVVSMIFGTTAEQSAAAAESLYDQQKGLSGVGSAAKKASKQLANFDEINKLSSDDSGGGGGGGAGGIEPNFDPSFIQDGIDSVLGLLVGAALLAVGAIMTFSGAHPLLGIALMIAGAMTMWAVVPNDPGLIAAMVESGLATVLQVIGPMIAIIGIVLLVTGRILLGISLIIAGIALFAVGAAAGEEGDFAENVKNKLLEAASILAPVLAVIGLLLIVTGHLLLGLGLFLAGLALWGIVEVTTDDGRSLQEKIISVLKSVATIVAPVLAVIGIFLVVTGHILLGLGFLIAGIALFAIAEVAGDEGKSLQEKILSVLKTVAEMLAPVFAVLGVFFLVTGNLLLGLGFLLAGIALFNIAEQMGDNGKSLQEKIMGVINGIAQALQVLGPALVVIGIILLFTGVAAPLGLGMIVAGAGMFLVGAIVPNWGFIKEAISGAYNDMIQWWDSTASQFFTLEYWAALAKNMLDGLFGGLANLGRRIADWGSSFINGVKDFFGIHSPADSTEEIGHYLMLGLDKSVNDDTGMVIASFSTLFTAVTALCTQNTELMQLSVAAFLAYFATQFVVQWEKGWYSCWQSANANITLVMADIDRLNAKLASIPRVINIKINIQGGEALGALGGLSGGSSASGFSARMAAMPPILPANIPALARGAVIPPNREFLAVLGDQRNGNNIEAPEDLLRQIYREEMGGGNQMLTLLQAILAAIKEGKVMEVDRQEFGRVVHRANAEESRRVGVSFAGVSRA